MERLSEVYSLPFIRFLIVGFSNLVLTYAVYLLALLIVNYHLAYLAAFAAGLLYTGILNIHHTFSRKLSPLRVCVYGLYYSLYALANIGAITLLVEVFAVSDKIAFLLVQVVFVPLHFIVSKLVIERIAPAR